MQISKTLKTKKHKFSSIELDRVKLILISSLILVIFWASFEQAGGLLNIFAYEKTNRLIESRSEYFDDAFS